MTRILDPTLSVTAAPTAIRPLAARPVALRGATVGLLANGKSNGMVLLDHLATRLRERHGIAAFVRVAKTNASAPVTEADADALAAGCAAVLTAIGD